MVVLAPTTSRPRFSPTRARTSSVAARSSAKIPRACSKSACPLSVSRTPLTPRVPPGPRSINARSSWCSSCRTALDTAGWLTNDVFAAREKLRCSATAAARAPIVIPWFAVLFIVASAVNSLHILPARLVDALIDIDTLLLATAMAALGLRTHVGAIRQAGLRPLLLAAALFAFLLAGGYAINRSVTALLG